MAVTLRLTRRGVRAHPFYRIVAADKQRPRNGKFLDLVGTYNPMVQPPQIVLKEDKVRKWLSQGALPSDVVRDLIKKQIPGLIEGRESHQLSKLQTARRKRKERAGKTAKKK